MKTWRWLGALGAMTVAGAMHAADEPSLPRPGSVVVRDVVGQAQVVASGQTRALKADERVRVGAAVSTGRRSLLTLDLSNGATVTVGPDSEVEIEEFGQEAFSSSIKPRELKQEPTISRTRLRLVRGDVSGEVKRLQAQRGSSFHVLTTAGTVRMVEGAFRVYLQMTEMGLGVCTVEAVSGVVEFEPAGGTVKLVSTSQPLSYAIELDRAGVPKISEMPPPPSTKGK